MYTVPEQMCIACFLDDDFQEAMREKSRIGRARFEEAILDFRSHFINALTSLVKSDKCPRHRTLGADLHRWLRALDDNIRSLQDTEDFITEVYDIYFSWIRGDVVRASQQMNALLHSRDLISEKSYLDRNFFFRGRNFPRRHCLSSRKVIDKRALYHIPFTERYKIRNQRYSLTGQPLMYFGLSIVDVLHEIRANPNSFTDVGFCCFVMIDYDDLDIYNSTNEFPDQIANIDILIEAGGRVDYDDPRHDFQRLHKIDFYKFILSSLCSFKRAHISENQVFAEEYVLPQLVTESLRNSNFDGIVFSSTRLSRNSCYSTEKYHVNRYRENLALFTKYEFKNDFDQQLLSRFSITDPVRLSDCQKVEQRELESIGQEIIQLNNSKRVFGSLKQLGEMSGISPKILFGNLLIADKSGRYVKYFDHPAGKVQLHLLKSALIDIRNRLLKST